MQAKLTAQIVEGANPSSSNSVIRFSATGPDTSIASDDLRWLLHEIQQTPCIFALPPPQRLPSLARGVPVDGLGATAAVAIMLQRQISYDVAHYQKRNGRGVKEHWWFECIEKDIGLAALRLARDLVGMISAKLDREPVKAAIAEKIDELLEPIDLSTWLMWRAAQRLRIPCRYMLSGVLYYELGLGARSRRVHKGMFEPETHISFRLGANKSWTAKLMHDAGLKVPLQRLVSSYEKAKETAAAIGYPVVVKPTSRGGQKGVILNIRSEAELQDVCSGIPAGVSYLVEKHMPGKSYRLLTVNGRLLNAYEYERPFVRGNGHDSIKALIAEENRSPLRGKGKRFANAPIDLETIEITRKTPFGDLGLTVDSVPEAGQRVDLSYFGTWYHAGTVREVTDQVHPDYERILQRAHATIPIPVCGYDFLCEDISAPPMEKGYAVNEINSFPALRNFRLEGAKAKSPLKLLHAITGGRDALRVPVVVVVTEQNVPSLTAAIAAAFGNDGRTVAIASRAGYFVGADRWGDSSHANLGGMHRAMSDQQAEAIVVERYAADLARSGLGLSDVDLVVFAPDLGRDVPRFLEWAAFMQGSSLKGNIFVNVPPMKVPASTLANVPNVVVWSFKLPEMSPTVDEVVFDEAPANVVVAQSNAGGGRRILHSPLHHSDVSRAAWLTAAAVKDRIDARTGD